MLVSWDRGKKLIGCLACCSFWCSLLIYWSSKLRELFPSTLSNPPNDNGSWRRIIPSRDFPAAPNRYHLYVGLFCPFAHRILITRELKGLQSILPLSIVKPYPKGKHGWQFASTEDPYPGSTIDHIEPSKYLSSVYLRSDCTYGGKYTVPVLWDKETWQIVNNESQDIMRMLNHAFDEFLPPNGLWRSLDFYPRELRGDIDAVNAWMMPNLNSGVYKAGFADTQQDYEKHCRSVFEALDRLESMLMVHGSLYILETLTEIDIKLYTTLVRFDTIYQQHFKLMVRSIRHGYPHLNRWLKNFYWNVPGAKETTNFKHIVENYSQSHADINPKSITPLGPEPEVESWTQEDEQWKMGIMSRSSKNVLQISPSHHGVPEPDTL